MFSTALAGCSGYAGQETLDRVLAHPELEVVALGSNSRAGKLAAALDLRLNGLLPASVPNGGALAAGADAFFLCLGPDEAAAFEPPVDAVVVDLSGGHRLRDADLYGDWYGFAHPFPAALVEWSYALPELYPPASRLIANPGCYATAALLALAPIAEAIEPDGIVVDAKSGVSGAGRALKASSHAGFVLENLSPYRIGSHQHAPELEQVLGFPVCFVPHLLPLRRGLLATCYVRAVDGDSRERLEDAYADSDVVRVLPEGVAPELNRVQGTDTAEVALFEDRSTGTTIVVCALDNLGKGAAGQAIQNANLARDLAVEEILVLSTGVIGTRLALDKVLPALRTAADSLSETGGADAAEAILTTDTHAKQAVADGPSFTVGGMAKGSGMIHPDLATMLAVVTTDYSLGPHEAQEFLRAAVEESFNAISVDGECSTNDTVVLLANGASGTTRSVKSDSAFDDCLRAVCADLASQIVGDGEGATFTAEISVSGAASDPEARAIARRIATSPLVKTALFGRDANWGRVLAAAGSAPYNGGYAQLYSGLGTPRSSSVGVVDGGGPQDVDPESFRGGCPNSPCPAPCGCASCSLSNVLSYGYILNH